MNLNIAVERDNALVFWLESIVVVAFGIVVDERGSHPER
jgi:hypothetical protein